MQLELKTLCIALAVLVCCGLCYFWGYRNAEIEGELILEQYKTAQADQNKAIQERVRIEYEKKLETLNADLERVRNDNVERVRQLEAYSKRERSLETCSRDLSAVSVLAIEGERLLKEADGYLRAFEH